MHRLLRNQLTKCRNDAGSVDVDRLIALVTATYDEVDRERKRTDRSTRLMIEELEAATQESAQAATALEKLAFYDPLTGLANRARFAASLDELAKHSCGGTPRYLLLLDLDRFKEVNDSLGHAAGDELLTRVGERLVSIAPQGTLIARLGGDEFAWILPPDHSQEAVARLTSQVIADLMQPIRLSDASVNIGVSIGIAAYPRDGKTISDLMRHADLALYEAKRQGRNTFISYNARLGEIAEKQLNLSREMRSAVADEADFVLDFQPQLRLDSGITHGFEALLRWNHPERGLILPSEFIPVAEAANQICKLDNLALRQATRQAKSWIDAGLPEREIAVNISALHLLRPDFVQEVEGILDGHALPPRLLCIELTESALADHENISVQEALRSLKRLGVQLALDDFGTHYSSLGYLIKLPFDRLKIDKVFVRGVDSSRRAQKLLSGIISLGHGLGMEVVAEGAETLAELDTVRALGANIVQGYAIARPTKAEQAVSTANLIDLRAMVLNNRLSEPDARPCFKFA